ncbi:MAG: tyrosine-protein phosphatase [Kiritimatiellae bacterium]|nr:tyrosine-protein phosphatase [Kiritimatiellia bacterium]
MKPAKLSFIIGSALSLAFLPCAEAAVSLLSPKDGSTFETLPDAQLAVLDGTTRTNRCEIAKKFLDDKQTRDAWRRQRPLVLKWKTTGGESAPWRVRLSRKADFSNGGDLWLTERDAKGQEQQDGSKVWTYTVPRANLELGAVYHWQVWSNVKCGEFRCGFTYPETCACGKSKAGHVSPVSTFRTSKQPPRWIALEGNVHNIRDIGGWATEDGGRIRTGLVYRGNGLNESSFAGVTRGRNRLTVEDVRYMTEVLGIKTDLDLRCPREIAGMDGSPLGTRVAFVNIDAKSYKELFTPEGRRISARLFRFFADRKNYPVYFHCTHGADRTGSLAYLLNGFLGVTREDLERDWESTCYPRVRGVDTPDDWRSCAFFDAGFAAYGKKDDSLSERIRLYLLDCGVTPEEMAAVRAILKEQPNGDAEAPSLEERNTTK